MNTLNNKTALITGAGSGIGQAIAVKFAQAGANVLITGRKEQPLQETAALHLASDAGAFITGADIAVDGGFGI